MHKNKDLSELHKKLAFVGYLFFLPSRTRRVNRRVVGVGEEVVDEVDFCDDVRASVVEGAEVTFVDKLIHVIFAEGRPAAP